MSRCTDLEDRPEAEAHKDPWKDDAAKHGREQAEVAGRPGKAARLATPVCPQAAAKRVEGQDRHEPDEVSGGVPRQHAVLPRGNCPANPRSLGNNVGKWATSAPMPTATRKAHAIRRVPRENLALVKKAAYVGGRPKRRMILSSSPRSKTR
jgi:hypothetical protein